MQLEAIRNDDEVINAELQEEEMNLADKEYKEEEAEEMDLWDPEKALQFAEEEMAKECDDPIIEDQEERDRIEKIFSGQLEYQPDPELETLFLQWRETHPEERPPQARQAKKNKILERQVAQSERKRKMAIRDGHPPKKQKRPVQIFFDYDSDDNSFLEEEEDDVTVPPPKKRKKSKRAAKENTKTIVESGNELEDSDDDFKPEKKKKLVFTEKDVKAMKLKSMQLVERVTIVTIYRLT